MTTHVGDGLYPKANWVGPIPNETPGALDAKDVMGVVFHVEQGSEAGTNSWFHNPNAEASAHLGNPQKGKLQQFVRLTDKAWAEVDGNSLWWSMEFEGFSGKAPAPTQNQIENAADFLAYAHLHTDGRIPLKKSDSTSKRGVGWHGMGGAAWGNHLDCPGDRIKAAREDAIKIAKEHVRKAKGMPVLKPGTKNHEAVKVLQRRLNAVRKCHLTVDGDYGKKTEDQVNALKKAHGWEQNGRVGAGVWHLLKED